MEPRITPTSGAASLPLPAAYDAALPRSPATADDRQHGTASRLAGLTPRRNVAQSSTAAVLDCVTPDAACSKSILALAAAPVVNLRISLYSRSFGL